MGLSSIHFNLICSWTYDLLDFHLAGFSSQLFLIVKYQWFPNANWGIYFYFEKNRYYCFWAKRPLKCLFSPARWALSYRGNHCIRTKWRCPWYKQTPNSRGLSLIKSSSLHSGIQLIIFYYYLTSLPTLLNQFACRDNGYLCTFDYDFWSMKL